jgi:hypothetical protein
MKKILTHDVIYNYITHNNKDNLLVINYIISNAKKATFNPFKGDKVQGV